MSERFGRFTDEARLALQHTQEEANRLNHRYVGTEHLLAGILRVSQDPATIALNSSGVDLNKVRSAIEFICGRGEGTIADEIGLTPRLKKVIELAAEGLSGEFPQHLTPAHLLKGIIREQESIAHLMLASFGVNIEELDHKIGTNQ